MNPELKKKDFPDQHLIDTIVRVMNEHLRPKRIILFGSRAAGKSKEYADFDIAVEGAIMGNRAVRRPQRRFPKTVDIEWLPPYAPEISPVEYIWTNVKYAKLANFIPTDIAHLHVRARHALKAAKSATHILSSCFDLARPKL